MRKSKFTDSQIMDAVKRVEAGFGVPDIRREMGISTATFYKWQAKNGGMDVSMMSRKNELYDESRRLKKMYLEEKFKAEIVSECLTSTILPPKVVTINQNRWSRSTGMGGHGRSKYPPQTIERLRVSGSFYLDCSKTVEV